VRQNKYDLRYDETIIPAFTRVVFTLQIQGSSPNLTDSAWDFFISKHDCKVRSYSKIKQRIIDGAYIFTNVGTKIRIII
jgi:hypothetical protein